MQIFFYFFSLAAIFVTVYGVSSPIVATKTGKLQGQSIQVPGTPTQLYQFTAIPFATPPLGQLRFKKTVPLEPWAGVLDATKLPNACTQKSMMGGNVIGEEDCLYLNVWVPKATLDAFANNGPNKQPLAVLVFIHGGGFQIGSGVSDMFNATYIVGMNNIIAVTIQYRLGSLGFGYLGNEEVAGNMGLWDQLEALKWISENIASFGGDNNQVTIGGGSAGSVSTSWHLLSANSRKYFHRAILQSGTAFSPWGRNGPEVSLASTNLIFGKVCNQTSQTASLSAKMQCLRSADAKQFAANDKSAETQVYEHIFHPVTAGDFLPRDPVAMLQAGEFYKVPLLIGANKDEGTMFVSTSPLGMQLLPGPMNPGKTMDSLTYNDYNTLMYDRNKQLGGETRYPVSPNQLLIDAVKLQYWPRNHEGDPKGREVYKAVYEAHGEMGMMCPTFYWANTTAQQVNDVFVYFYTHNRASMGSSDPVASHGGEAGFISGMPFAPQTGGQTGGPLGTPPSGGQPGQAPPPGPPPSTYTEQEKQLSLAMMTFWSNFVKYGNPNGAGNGGTNYPNWPRHVGSTCKEQYFELNEETILPGATRNPVICGVRKPNCLFWQEYMPKLEEKLLGTSSSSNSNSNNNNNGRPGHRGGFGGRGDHLGGRDGGRPGGHRRF